MSIRNLFFYANNIFGVTNGNLQKYYNPNDNEYVYQIVYPDFGNNISIIYDGQNLKKNTKFK